MPFEIPESWEWTTIGEIASSILYGVSESSKDNGKYKLLRITDIQNNKVNWDTVPFTDFDDNKAKSYLLQNGDILFARTGATVGKSYLVEGLSHLSIYASYLIRVQTSNTILPAYIKYFFESEFYWEQISLNSIGIGQPNVNGTTLSNLLVPIPPYCEQKRIVDKADSWLNVIDTLDNDIFDLKSKINFAKSKILDHAISGKLVPQDHNDEPAIELLKRINPNFEPCDNSHYENLPENWEEIVMGEICKLYDGEKVSGPSLTYIDVKFLRGSKVGEFVTSGKYVPQGSTLILVDGENSGEVFTTPIDGYQGSTFKILGITEYLDKEYVLLLIKRSQKLLRENKVGSAIPHLNKKMFKELIVHVPPLAEQNRIVTTVNMLFYKLDMITAEL